MTMGDNDIGDDNFRDDNGMTMTGRDGDYGGWGRWGQQAGTTTIAMTAPSHSKCGRGFFLFSFH
jgi:hypothetical protein